MTERFEGAFKKTSMKLNSIVVFVVVVMITSLAFSPALADKPRISSEVEAVPSYELSADEQKAISHSAARVLKHADQAREAIGVERYKDAEKNIDQALLLIKIIENVLPDYTVKAKIKAGDLTYSDEENIKPVTVKIYDELERREILSPVEDAKKEEAEERAEKAGLSLPVDVELVSTKAELNIASAKASLKKAKKNLEDKKYEAADTILRTVQTGVLLSYTKVDLPLMTARKNLIIAKNLVDSGEFKEAEFALNVATDALERYEASVGEHRAKEANELREEINKLSKNLSQDQAASSEKLQQWWDKILEWFE